MHISVYYNTWQLTFMYAMSVLSYIQFTTIATWCSTYGTGAVSLPNILHTIEGDNYSTRLELVYSLFEHILRIFMYNKQTSERNSEQTWENWNLGGHVFAINRR